jgi:AraC-like DNA-binding protein/mannose-6-phosphate isomerase-like protein (cupin superfamily)
MTSGQSTGNRSKLRLNWENVHSVVESQIRADGTHVWPFNPSFPIDVRAFAFGEYRNIRRTRHDYFEILYVYSGKAQYQVQDRRFLVGKGDLIVVNGMLYHRLREIQIAPFQAVVLYFLPDIICSTDASGEDVQYLMPFLVQNAGFPNTISDRTGLPAEILSLMVRIRSNLPASTDRAQLTVRTFLKMILVLLVNHYGGRLGTTATFVRRQRVHDRLRPLFEYLDAHYQDHLPPAKGAALLGMSKSHFMRYFKKFTGQSFVGYLNRFRIAKGQSLLTSTDKSISEVSQEVGFCDQSYFGLVFRRLVRMTPRDYRKRCLQKV